MEFLLNSETWITAILNVIYNPYLVIMLSMNLFPILNFLPRRTNTNTDHPNFTQSTSL